MRHLPIRPLCTWLCALLCALLGACAEAPTEAPPPPSLFLDDAFQAPAQRYSAADLFDLSEPMRRFLDTDIAHQLHTMGRAQGLVEALYRKGQLQLDYDASITRTAAQAFEARAGNCLSLVIMTAAFAKQLDLQVEYHSAKIDEVWSRHGNLLVGSGHVNLSLSTARHGGFDEARTFGDRALLVDFLPSENLQGLPLQAIPEQAIVAMYMNNRAVEALMQGQIDDAYGWARAAIGRSPTFDSAYNTLGIVYLRHGDVPQAVRVFRHQLERRPTDANVMANLADALERNGDAAGASDLRQRLARLDPDPPYALFNRGMEAFRRGDLHLAREMFAREVARADYNDEFHFWLGVTYFELGQVERARRQLLLALERSQSSADQRRYAAKLAWLQQQTQKSAPPATVR